MCIRDRLYGSTRYASERLRAALGLALAAEPLEGVLHIETSLPLDTAEVGKRSQTLMHDALVSNGGVYEVTRGEGSSEVVCTASADGQTRVYAVFADKCGKNGNGKVFWAVSYTHLDTVLRLSDVFNGCMALPNLLGLVVLSKTVIRLTPKAKKN